MTPFEYFLNNIYDAGSANKTTLTQIGDFIEYINNNKDISIDIKIYNTILVLEKVKAFDDTYLKQLPYTSKTTSLLTYLLIEKLINENILTNSKDEPFLLCDLTYGYGMQFYWVVKLLKKNLLHSKQTFITVKYDKYFSIGSYYKEIEFKNKKLRVYFNDDDTLVNNQIVTHNDNIYSVVIDIDIKFNKANLQKTKTNEYKKDLLKYTDDIDCQEDNIFYIVDRDSNNIFKINKNTNTYQKMAKNKLININEINESIILDINTISRQTVDITNELNSSSKVEIKKLKLDYEDNRTEPYEIDYFDFKNYNNLEYAGIKLKNISNSIYILDLPSNDIISEDSGIADKILMNIKIYLRNLNSTEQQIFIISTAKGKNDFKDESLYKGSIKLSGKFMPLTDTAMNLIILSNANIQKFEIDLSNDELLNVEMNRIFSDKKEIKQKLAMKDIDTCNSLQYKFINQINNKKAEDLFTNLSLGDYRIINNTLFKNKNDTTELLGIITCISLEDSLLKIRLVSDELIEILFNSQQSSIVFNNNELLFKNYVNNKLQDNVYKEPNSIEIHNMYKSLVNKLYEEVN